MPVPIPGLKVWSDNQKVKFLTIFGRPKTGIFRRFRGVRGGPNALDMDTLAARTFNEEQFGFVKMFAGESMSAAVPASQMSQWEAAACGFHRRLGFSDDLGKASTPCKTAAGLIFKPFLLISEDSGKIDFGRFLLASKTALESSLRGRLGLRLSTQKSSKRACLGLSNTYLDVPGMGEAMGTLPSLASGGTSKGIPQDSPRESPRGIPPGAPLGFKSIPCGLLRVGPAS